MLSAIKMIKDQIQCRSLRVCSTFTVKSITRYNFLIHLTSEFCYPFLNLLTFLTLYNHVDSKRFEHIKVAGVDSDATKRK